MSISDELDDAVICVARAAQELSDGAEIVRAKRGAPYENGFTVKEADMQELREALKRWKVATNAFLELAHNQGADTGSKG